MHFNFHNLQHISEANNKRHVETLPLFGSKVDFHVDYKKAPEGFDLKSIVKIIEKHKTLIYKAIVKEMYPQIDEWSNKPISKSDFIKGLKPEDVDFHFFPNITSCSIWFNGGKAFQLHSIVVNDCIIKGNKLRINGKISLEG